MDFQPILQAIIQQGVWCALFCYLFYTTNKESHEREERLNSIIENQKNILGEISNSLILLNERIERVEEKLLGGKGKDEEDN